MRASRTKARRLLYAGISLLFWLGLWDILARAVKLSFALPSVADTALALFGLLITGSFWLTVLASLGRILLGLAIGVLLALLLAPLSVHLALADAILTPVMQFIKSTPVASFILVLWVLIGRATVPIAIAVLMVLPIVYQNLCAALRSLDKKQAEVLRVFHVPHRRALRIFVLPSLLSYFVPALITSAALAWKAGIAAEIIAYTKQSIGRAIYDAKVDFDGPLMFAWTVAVILLSLLIEKGLSYLGRRVHTHGTDRL